MAKAPAFAEAFAGRWRIAETDVWDHFYIHNGDDSGFVCERG